MKRITSLLIVLILTASVAVAQETKEEEFNTIKEYRNKVFAIQNREPNAIASAVKLLGSGFRGAALSVNSELRTITVRDFPENIAAMEEAIKRLDRPVAQRPEVEMKISVLIGSRTAIKDNALPDELNAVVKQLQSTLTYSHYGLMASAVHRTRVGVGIEGSGVAESTLLGMTTTEDRPIFYQYKARGLSLGSSEAPSVGIDNFEFSMQVPLDVGSSGIQYKSVGFQTPVSLRPNEKVVIGTTTMRDKVLIVVVTANINQ